jgi:putative membrane protein
VSRGEGEKRPLPPLPERETLRLHQANERTLLAWMRTSLAMMGFGFVLARFGLFLRELALVQHQDLPPSGAPVSLWLGAGLAGAGVLTLIAALSRHRQVELAIERHEVGSPGHAFVYVVGGVVVAIGFAILALLLVTE